MEICMNWFAHVIRFYLFFFFLIVCQSVLVVQRREVGNAGSKEGQG